MGIPYPKRGAKSYSTSREILDKLVGINPIIDKLIEYRTLTKLYNTYIIGIKNAIKLSYPTSFYQRCVVHIVRDLKTYTNKNNTKSIIADFKNIYSAPSLELAKDNYEYFLDKYKDNKTIIKHVKDYMDDMMPLFNLPINIRKYIYTNNIVESVNSKIKRGFYGRGALPNVNSALNIIFLNLDDLEKKWSKTKVPNWNNIYNELILVHKQDIEQYL